MLLIVYIGAYNWYDVVLESGVDLDWEKTKPGTAGCCCLLQLELAPGVLGSRLPLCSCLAMAQQSYRKKYTNEAEPRGAVQAAPIAALGAQRRRRCSAAYRSIDSCSVLARVFFFLFFVFFLVFQTRGHKTP